MHVMPMVRTLSTACKRSRQGDAQTRGCPALYIQPGASDYASLVPLRTMAMPCGSPTTTCHETASRELLGIMRRTPLLTPHAARIDLALAYNARPAADLPPTGMKPVTPNAFRAAFTASIQALMVLLYALFARAEDFFETTLPFLFFIKPSFVKPLWVFCFRPENTEDLARDPLAMMLTFFAFFMALFMAAPFMAAFFMAPAFFIAAAFFMGSAIA